MKAYFLILAALVNSVLISGCAMNRANSLRMLSERAEYDVGPGPELALREAGIGGFKGNPTPIRSRAKVATAFLHPQPTANPDFYFWGGWVSIVVERDDWVLKRLNKMPKAPAIIDLSNNEKPKTKAALKKK